jgi:gluconolactonase
MRKSCGPVAAIALVTGITAACADSPVDKPVTKKDPALDALVSSDAKLEEISTGYGFTEGLVWVPKGKGGYLLLSDMPANVIYKLSTDGKEKSLYLDHSGYTGFDIWRVGFMQTNGRSKDDPRYEEFPMIGSNGLALDREGGKTAAVIRDIPHTNGLAFSPDEKILYANGSRERFVRAYDVQADGTLTNSRLLIDLNSDPRPGITDGMKVDTMGNIWESGPGGIWILSPQGTVLGHIQVPELVANVAFGDPHYKTLYIAARNSVYKIRTNVAGIP